LNNNQEGPGISYLPFEAAVVVCSGLAAWAIKRVPVSILVAAGSLTASAGFLLLAGLEAGAAYGYELLPALLITGAGIGIALVPLTTAATAGVPVRDTGLASGLLSTCQQIGGAIGVAVLVTVASSRIGPTEAEVAPVGAAMVDGLQLAFQVGAFMLVAAAVVASLIGRGAHREQCARRVTAGA
jgi:hypothetical protein